MREDLKKFMESDIETLKKIFEFLEGLLSVSEEYFNIKIEDIADSIKFNVPTGAFIRFEPLFVDGRDNCDFRVRVVNTQPNGMGYFELGRMIIYNFGKDGCRYYTHFMSKSPEAFDPTNYFKKLSGWSKKNQKQEPITPRGMQVVSDINVVNKFPCLTVERWNKWYTIYAMDENGNLTSIEDAAVNSTDINVNPDILGCLSEEAASDWYKNVTCHDHAWDPGDVIWWCSKYNYYIGENAYKALVNMWVEQYAENVGFEEEYLPLKSAYDAVVVPDGDYDFRKCTAFSDEDYEKFQYYASGDILYRVIMYGNHEGMQYAVYATSEGYLCGYIGMSHIFRVQKVRIDEISTIDITYDSSSLPEDDMVEAKYSRMLGIYPDRNGRTYNIPQREWWIGFECNHIGEHIPSMELFLTYFPDLKNNKNIIRRIKSRICTTPNGRYIDNSKAEKMCHDIIDEILKMSKS